MKYFYIAKDFLMTRNGKSSAFAAAIALAAAYVGIHLKNQKEEAPITSIPQPSAWENDSGELNAPIQQTQRNKSFELFTPIPPKAEKIAPLPKPKPKRQPVTQPQKATVQLIAPLFKEQRKTSKAAQLVKSPALPKLEAGALIHCRLLTPATTDHPNLPVIAQITRSVIRDGIPLFPKGSKITGTIKTSQNKRIFFAPDWQVYLDRHKSINLSAQLQEKSYNAKSRSYNLADGRIGLAGVIENEQESKRFNILGEVIKGIAALSKDSIRTTAGEYIPSSGKNAAINISSTVIDGLLPKSKQQTIKQAPYIHVPAGTEFYLMITPTNQARAGSDSQKTSIDQLWAEAMRKRLRF